MIKTLDLEGRQVELNSSAGWLYLYQEQFGRDILPEVMPMIEGILSLAIRVLQQNGNNDITVQSLAEVADGDILDDVFARLAGLETITFLNIFWALAKNADADIPGPAEFYRGIDVLPIDKIVPEVLELVISSSVSRKNARSLLSKMSGLKGKLSA